MAFKFCEDGSTDTLVKSEKGVIVGYSFKNTNAGSSEIIIHNGITDAAEEVIFITLAENESIRDMFSDGGLQCEEGIYVEIVSGTCKGSVWYR